jgi:hypothetical protein
MSDNFKFDLTDEEKTYLKDLVRLSIASGLKGERAETEIPEPPTAHLRETLGAFVTLTKSRELRGCIGNVQGRGQLYKTVWEMARAAAFDDPRFSPLSVEEFEGIKFEISILSAIEVCPDPKLIEVGRHGLIIRKGMYSGLLLPQVAVEWGWNREQFLEHTCNKAGLHPDAWKEPDTLIFWFEAVVF